MATLTTTAELLKELKLERLEESISKGFHAPLTLAKLAHWIKFGRPTCMGSLNKAGVTDFDDRTKIT